MNVSRRRVLAGVVLACLVGAPVFGSPGGAWPVVPTPEDDGPDGQPGSAGGEAGPASLRLETPPRTVGYGATAGTARTGASAVAAARVAMERPATPTWTPGSSAIGRSVGAATDTSDLDRSRTSARPAGEDQIDLTQTLALTPERPGEITVTLSYSVPSQVTKLSTEVPKGATVVETNGFSAASETRYEWTGATASPSLTYRLPANVTGEGTGPVGAAGDYLFVDAGPWALVRIPPTSTGWSWRGTRPRLVHERTTAGPGATGEAIAFLGEHAVHTRTAHGQRFRLVVPAAASLGETPDAVLADVAAASDAIRVGDRDEQVLLVAAPTDGVTWGVRGLQAGPADAWVRDGERLDDAANVWIHEYVHTRQAWTGTEETRWVTEATATYYAALLALERGHVQYAAFEEFLAAGARSPQSTSILARPATWRDAANYQKGALVAGDLDRRIRLASDRRRSLQNVLRAMNGHGEPVTAAAFLSMVAEAADASVSEWADRFTTTEAVPSTWNRDAHEAAFGATPAYLEVALATEHAIRGPYRNRSLRGGTVTLVPEETLTVRAVVQNAGGVADDHVTTISVDGEPRATRTGRVGAGETVRLDYAVTFETVGSHSVTVGDVTLEVEVRRPAEAAVTGLSVDSRTVEPGDSVTITATVRNDARVPGQRTVAFRVDGRTVATREVRLDAGEQRQVTATTTFDAPGSYRVDAGGEGQVTVVVASPDTPTDASTNTPAPVAGDGLGVATALLGVAVLLVGLRLRPGDGGVLGVGPRRER